MWCAMLCWPPWEVCPFPNGDEGGEPAGVEEKFGEEIGKEEGGEIKIGMLNKWEKLVIMFEEENSQAKNLSDFLISTLTNLP